MKEIQNNIRQKLSTEDEPYEGDIDIKEVEKEVIDNIAQASAKSEGRFKFVFDGYAHQNVVLFIEFLEKFGKPQFVACTTADEKKINKRYNLANEAEEDAEIGEEALEALKAKAEANLKEMEDMKNVYAPNVKSMKFLDLDTCKSLESIYTELRSAFQPKVLIVNHEKRLGIDTTCSNLAIKYQLIYISAY